MHRTRMLLALWIPAILGMTAFSAPRQTDPAPSLASIEPLNTHGILH